MASCPSLPSKHGRPTVEAYLLGQVGYADALALQQRLVYETSGRSDGQITLLVCEHPPIIAVGRQGSRGHIRASQVALEQRQLDVRWVNRGGGCLMHAPGQIALYPIVPLDVLGLTVGEYLRRLQEAMADALAEMKIRTLVRPGRHGLWGRTGQLAFVGVAVKNWTTYHGGYINVCPPLGLCRLVDSDPQTGTPPSSLVAERQAAVRMSGVRERLVRQVAAKLSDGRYHIYGRHPLLTLKPRTCLDATARAG